MEKGDDKITTIVDWWTLPIEIWCNIIQFLPDESRYVIPSVSKLFREIITTHYRYFYPCPAGYYLYPEQIEINRRLNESKKKLFTVISPMSSGKTAVCLM